MKFKLPNISFWKAIDFAEHWADYALESQKKDALRMSAERIQNVVDNPVKCREDQQKLLEWAAQAYRSESNK